jgi:predicted nucleic acid-binding protein
MPTKPKVYIDSCGFIDAVKQSVGVLPSDRDADVWHIKKLMGAHRNGEILVLTSYLTLAECVAIEVGQPIVPEDIKEQFRRLLNSGQYVELLHQTPRTGQIAQNLRWKHKLVLAGADALHFAAAIEAAVDEFITTDERLKKEKVAASIDALGRRRNAVLTGALSPRRHAQRLKSHLSILANSWTRAPSIS